MLSSFVNVLGSGFMVLTLMGGELAGLQILTPIAVAQSYQDTLQQKMVYLKQGQDRWIEINLTTQQQFSLWNFKSD